MGDIIREQEVLIKDPSSENTATVSDTEPTGTEVGLYSRIVSHPVIKANDEEGFATPVGYGLSDLSLPVDINPKKGLIDGFGRIRSSEPFVLSGGSQVLDSNTTIYTSSTTGGGSVTYVTNESTTNLIVGTASGDTAIRQTKQYIPYQTGRSKLVLISGVMGALKTNVRQRIGHFDTNNGLFFEQDGTNLKVVSRSFVTGTAVDTAVNQSSWNIDPLDGTGPSGITLDTSKVQIFTIDFEWLGAGRARMGFIIDGVFVYCHEFLSANVISTVWATTPALPIRWEISNTSTTASSTTLKQICHTVMSEGGFNPRGIVIAENSGTTGISATSNTPIFALRLKSGYSRATVIPQIAEFMVTNNSNAVFDVYIGGTLTGGAWNATTGNATEYNITATSFTTTGGKKLATAFINSSSARTATQLFDSKEILTASDVTGTSEVLTIVAHVIGGGSATSHASLTWKEVY